MQIVLLCDNCQGGCTGEEFYLSPRCSSRSGEAWRGEAREATQARGADASLACQLSLDRTRAQIEI